MQHAEARALGLKKYNTGKPCIRGHLSDRYTHSGHCVRCRLDDGAALSITPERQAWKASYENTAAAKALRAQRNARYVAKPEKAAAYKETKKRWHRGNLDRGRMYSAARRARIQKATPPWVDMAAILKVYVEADRISRETGVQHEVDHIYPLAGRNSCGLHVPWNLQIILKPANRRKSNKPPEEVIPDILIGENLLLREWTPAPDSR